jgi:hypothetical protein
VAVVGEANDSRVHVPDLTHDFWGVGRWQKANPFGDEGGCEPDSKMIAVSAGIQNRDSRRDTSRELLNIGQKLPRGHRFAGAIRHRRFR